MELTKRTNLYNNNTNITLSCRYIRVILLENRRETEKNGCRKIFSRNVSEHRRFYRTLFPTTSFPYSVIKYLDNLNNF